MRAYLVFAWLLVLSTTTLAARCDVGQLAGGLHCGCPDLAAQVASGAVFCPNGTVPVIYDLGQPFPPDGTTSSITLVGSRRSPCEGLAQPVAVRGRMVGCWGALDDGCRTFHVAYTA